MSDPGTEGQHWCGQCRHRFDDPPGVCAVPGCLCTCVKSASRPAKQSYQPGDLLPPPTQWTPDNSDPARGVPILAPLNAMNGPSTPMLDSGRIRFVIPERDDDDERAIARRAAAVPELGDELAIEIMNRRTGAIWRTRGEVVAVHQDYDENATPQTQVEFDVPRSVREEQ